VLKISNFLAQQELIIIVVVIIIRKFIISCCLLDEEVLCARPIVIFITLQANNLIIRTYILLHFILFAICIVIIR
jgi:hypothetical protein